MHAGVLVAAGVALFGAIIALIWLPARASSDAYEPLAPEPFAVPEAEAEPWTRADDRHRGPGPAAGPTRSTEADDAILTATVEIFAEVGLEGLTVEGVAARAGVGKATIYRRYPGKVELVVAAARCFTHVRQAPPDTGSTRGDLAALVDGLISMLTTTPLGRALPILVAARTRVPELDIAYSEIVAEKRARSTTVIRRGIERGDLRADVDPEIVVDCFVSPIFYRFLVTDAPLDAAFAARSSKPRCARSLPSSRVIDDRAERRGPGPPGREAVCGRSRGSVARGSFRPVSTPSRRSGRMRPFKGLR